MDPPAYAAPRPPGPPRSINDLRCQIIANGTLLKPSSHNERPADNHLEVVVARTPHPNAPSASPGFSEKQTSAAASSAPVATSSSSSSSGGKHYAILIQRTNYKKDIKIMIKGELRDTVEEALEWVLERTEIEIHGMVTKYGRSAPDAECRIM